MFTYFCGDTCYPKTIYREITLSFKTDQRRLLDVAIMHGVAYLPHAVGKLLEILFHHRSNKLDGIRLALFH
jgi:DNA relaxase NicK